ncbi:MAG TPA: flagellar basal-body MS-ring/collar protein FliF [Bacteroidota bacterium]|nr:flagellar basal-body MS-ring/collar protein FliF [Bacteroidota bacterium]
MADNQFGAQQQIAGLIRRTSLGQKVLLVVVALGVIGAIIAMVTMVNQPTYATLFNGLNADDASKIVTKLKEKSVPYRLDDSGKSILVPKDQVYELRLALAGDGLPQSSVIGYEIFDRTNLGVSDFVQKVNYRRALEGELARTILQLEEVEGARVHLALPEKALFKEDEKNATASVVLKLRSGKPLRRESVQGIAHLVASSVEGLESSDVSIVDSRGILLSDNAKGNTAAAMTSSQYELQQQVETYLGRKAQSLLESVVGAGNAVVQVSAELDFRQVERTLEQYDPENTAVRSEQISEDKSVTSDSAPPSTRSSTVTNYEVNKTVEHIVENLGNIKRLSVAALVNGTTKQVETNGVKSTENVPRAKDDMDKMTDLVKRAVGFNPLRSDEVTVTNLSFGTPLQEQDFVYKQSPPLSDYNDIIQKVFLVAAMAGGVVLIRSLLGRLRVTVGQGSPGYATAAATAAAELQKRKEAIRLPAPEEEISEEAMVRAEKRRRVTEYIKDKPTETSRLLKVWLAEE